MTFRKSLSIQISIICLLIAVLSALAQGATKADFPQSALFETLTHQAHVDSSAESAAATTSGTSLSETAISLAANGEMPNLLTESAPNEITEIKLLASDGAKGDEFGSSVAGTHP